ncbi:MAG: rRNA maturation RNase YbeY [Actinomycetota bacterium]|nr:rRNA maturation RNase YbeY [Actinomycetota bacterium]
MTVELNNESGADVDEERLGALSRYVLKQMQIHPQAELSVVLLDVAAMTQLNEEFMEETGPTDVLAFPMDELRPGDEDTDPEPGLLGDVVLCAEVAARQAEQAGHGLPDELDLLCTHGILHLLGYDHHEPDEERQMFGIQARLLAAWQAERPGVGGDA